MLDLVRLYLKAGDGGNGRVAFFRNKHVLKGGPFGGKGGDGGSIVVKADAGLNTLQNYSGVKKFIAEEGELGGKNNKEGKKGENIVLKVPLGTAVWLASENEVSARRRERHGLERALTREEAELQKYYVERETQAPIEIDPDEIDSTWRPNFMDYLQKQVEMPDGEYLPLETGHLLKLTELKDDGEEVLLAQGGFGGRGNTAFKGPANTTPMEAERGSFGEQKMIFFELRLLANVGLVGEPNKGKSSLLSRLTKAQPKIANYPFTTLEPNLGVMKLSPDRSLVIADIPGLVEGASENKGLGFQFLRHVQNSAVLVFVLSLSEEEIFTNEVSEMTKAGRLWQQYIKVKQELSNYKEKLKNKKALIVVNKADLYEEVLRAAIENKFTQEGEKMLFTSTVTGENLETLQEQMWSLLKE